eukprot:6440984-Amphidinium_carterae.1
MVDASAGCSRRNVLRSLAAKGGRGRWRRGRRYSVSLRGCISAAYSNPLLAAQGMPRLRWGWSGSCAGVWCPIAPRVRSGCNDRIGHQCHGLMCCCAVGVSHQRHSSLAGRAAGRAAGAAGASTACCVADEMCWFMMSRRSDTVSAAGLRLSLLGGGSNCVLCKKAADRMVECGMAIYGEEEVVRSTRGAWRSTHMTLLHLLVARWSCGVCAVP